MAAVATTRCAEMTLRELCPDDEAAFRIAIAEWGYDPDSEFAFDFDPDEPFDHYIAKLARWSRGEDIPERFVANTFLIGVLDDGRIVGRISIRHELNEILFTLGGHIGYMVVPKCRRQGYGTRLLAEAIPVAHKLKIDRILVTCDEDNIGSRKIIEANGGVYENTFSTPNMKQPKRRYWIDPPAVIDDAS